MSQNSLTLPTTGTVSGLTMTQNTNNALDTLNTLASGAAAPSSPEAGQFWHDTTNNLLKIRSLDNAAWISLFSLNESAYTGNPVSVGAFANCVFKYTSTSVCTLFPSGGNRVTFPSGTIATIGASGITTTVSSCYLNGTAGQSLSANTLYYAYLALVGGNYVIDWSATGHVTDSTSGIEVKSGDATRVLVGMAYVAAGPIVSNSIANRLVRSWFNDAGITGSSAFTTNRSYSSPTLGEINSEIRISFLSWASENVTLDVRVAASIPSAGNNIGGGIAIDSTSVNTSAPFNAIGSGANYVVSMSQVTETQTLSEGLHYATLLGESQNSVAVTYYFAFTTINLITHGNPS